MKLFFAVLVSAAAVMAADGQAPAKKASPAAPKAASKSTAKAPEKVNDASKPAAIPAGAVADATGDYRYTDPQGKKWIYRKTPFGVTRLEDSAENAAPKAAAASGGGITAFDEGDKVRFERKGPFGVWKWEKKKSEMDESERAALQNSQANRQHVSKQ
ncbi:MAG: hypothetical protein ABI806_28365 [Candidatus Solibacter sp.]